MKFLFLSCLFPALLAAQTTPTTQLTEQLGKTVLYGDVAISPDGTHAAWVQSTAATVPKNLWITPTSEKARPTMVKIQGSGERTDSDPAFSPDSKTVAFFSTAGEKDQVQLWTTDVSGANAHKQTHLEGYAARPHWSHDGKKIAFLYVEEATGGGPLLAAPATTGVIDTAIHNQRIAVLDLTTNKLQPVSPPDLHVYDFDWSPNDQTFVATAAPGPGDNNWWVAKIYTIDLAKGQATSIYKPSLQVAVPRWSPDGKSIAFIEGLMSDEGFHGGDLFTMSNTGQQLVNRTKNHRGSISSLFWPVPERMVVTEALGGGSAISELTLADNVVRTIWKGAEGVHAFGNFPNFALSSDGQTAAVVLSSFETAPEVWAGLIAQWRRLTNNNSAQEPAWGKAINLEWKSDDLNIQGWILPPKVVDPGKRYPMVVQIHGGPSGLQTSDWPASTGMSRVATAVLASKNYFVLMPNPRGSYGQGEAFTRANIKDFGGGDLRDIIKGIDAATAQQPIDPVRIGVTGWSYGGFMTMWAVTQTNRFRAAVAGAGIANWQSYYGQNLIDQWMIPFFGASVYDDPAVYEKSTPLRFIKNVKTPTLILVGERDAECPTPQSYEFWHALKTLGITTQLVVYEGEGHMFLKPEHQIDRLNRTVAWFDKYLD